MTQATDDKPFDRKAAEEALTDYLKDTVGWVETFESRAAGVIAFERLDSFDSRKVDFDDLARHLSEKMGVAVVNVANCDWSFDDRCDEEATYVAFGVPDLDGSYAETYRTRLSNDYLDSLEAGQESAPAP